MRERDDIVRILCRGPDGIQKTGHILAEQDTGSCIGCFRSIDIVLRTGGSNIGNREAACFQVYGSSGFLYIAAGTHIGDLRFFQSGQRIQEGFFPIIIRMIVGQPYDVDAQVMQIGYMGGVGPEGKGLAGQRLAARTVGELVIDPHQVHMIHDVDIGRVDAVGNVFGADRGQKLHGDIVIGKIDVAGKAEGKIVVSFFRRGRFRCKRDRRICYLIHKVIKSGRCGNGGHGFLEGFDRYGCHGVQEAVSGHGYRSICKRKEKNGSRKKDPGTDRHAAAGQKRKHGDKGRPMFHA